MTSDGTEDAMDAEARARGFRPQRSDGTEDDFFEEDEPLEDVVTAFEGGTPLLTVVDETTAFRDVSSATASCCGSDLCGSGIVGMFAGPGDLARRAKDIVRRDERRDEALTRIVAEDEDLLRRLAASDGPVESAQ